jgi:hypothetical protein
MSLRNTGAGRKKMITRQKDEENPIDTGSIDADINMYSGACFRGYRNLPDR